MKLPRVVHFLAFGLLLLVIPEAFSSLAAAQIGIGISVRIGPPPLPIYRQPLCPGPGYLWTPGYWAWSDDDGYYWVPGTWLEAPEVGFLWTPGYWRWNEGFYAWNAGYWGPHIGFYGGINYGFGYGGEGFEGGEWRGRRFFYNRSVTNVNVTNVTNVYDKTVIVNNNTHVAYNGGQGGIAARPTPQQQTYAHESHRGPVAAQMQHQQAASRNRALFARENHGRPPVAATARPADFKGRGVVAAKAAGGTYHAPMMSPKQARVSGPAGGRAVQNHSSGNGPTENRAANRPVQNRSSSSNGSKADYHPVTPTNGRNTSKSNTWERPPSANRPQSNSTMSANRPFESHSAKPYSPPNSHTSNTQRLESAPRMQNARPSSESRPANGQGTRTSHESRPQSAPRPVPQARERSPRPASQARENTAKPSASAPRPQRQSEPPKRENPPKGKGTQR
ncbi:MAG: putative rane protein [Candidatus Sulfotelmatobacter sp.]|nr:putative rane protein [Candidatus Sulfotelmatobacter sp.]